MKRGDRYKIRNNTISGTPIIEGVATLKRPHPTVRRGLREDLELWMVYFDGDEPGQGYVRWVDPEDRVELCEKGAPA